MGGWAAVALSAVVMISLLSGGECPEMDNGNPSIDDPTEDPNVPAPVFPQVRITVEYRPAGEDVDRKRANFVIQLDDEKAPISSENFLAYVDAGFYDDTVIHRVAMEPEVVQGGGFEVDPNAPSEDLTSQPLIQKPTLFDPIENESGNGLKNIRGSIGVARLNDPDSGTSQWYINVEDNPGIDPLGNPPGFTVFGHVVGGMSVVDEILVVPTETRDELQGTPIETVKVVKAERIGQETDDDDDDGEEVPEPEGPRVRVNVEYTTTDGVRINSSFVIELDDDLAPLSTANFLSYVDVEFYTNTVIHRVDTALGVVQGGGFIVDEEEDPGDGDLTSQPLELKPPLFGGVMNEASNGLLNVRGSVGVARTNDPDSGNSQWYVNTDDNPGLDPEENPPGFAVFGKVVEGMDVVDEIQVVEKEVRDTLMNVPVETVLITSIVRVE